MSAQRFEVGQKVIRRGTGPQGHRSVGTVARSLKCIVHLDDGSKFWHTGAPYPRSRNYASGDWIEHASPELIAEVEQEFARFVAKVAARDAHESEGAR